MKTGTSLSDLNHFKVPVDPFLSLIDIPWPCPQNRVVVTNLNTTFNHKQAVGMISGASFKNCRLSAYTARFYDPGQFVEPTGQGFTSGLYVSMGTNSERVSLLFIHIFRGIASNIPNLAKRPRNSPMYVCNKVSSGFYDPLDIENFERNDKTRVVRHKKSFSGIIYRKQIRFNAQNVKQVSISVFKSGNYIVMNVEGMEALIAFINILPILHRNKLDKGVEPTADQLVTFVRQEYLQFDPSKESIIECVKRAISKAQRSVITREEIIQRAIQNANLVRSGLPQLSDSQIEEIVEDDEEEEIIEEIFEIPEPQLLQQRVTTLHDDVDDEFILEEEPIEDIDEYTSSSATDYDSDVLDIYEQENWSDSDKEAESSENEDFDPQGIETIIDSDIDNHNLAPSSKPKFKPSEYINIDSNKKQRR